MMKWLKKRIYAWHLSKIAPARIYLGNGSTLKDCSIENTTVVVPDTAVTVVGCLFVNDAPQ